MMRWLVFGTVFALGGLFAFLRPGPPTARAEARTPRELGDVTWSRSLDRSLAAARASGKPVLILFDEVPGCQTCVRYGEVVLTDPLLVEAAETLFEPVAIYNNRGGNDRRALERFGEPAWNNPVVRIVSAEGKGLAPRHAGDYSREGLAKNMVTALEAAGRPVPPYLQSLVEPAAPARATFSMYCFWSGEACLGSIPGVVGARTGFIDGREGVEVTYDPDRISLAELARAAKAKGCAERFHAKSGPEARTVLGAMPVVQAKSDLRPSPKDDKYHLRRSRYRDLKLNSTQALWVNSRLARGESVEGVLSAKQRREASR